MAEKLMHLPTKPTMVHPEGESVFVRRQHYQPNQREAAPKEREGQEPNQEKPGIGLPRQLLQIVPKREPQQGGVQLKPEHNPHSFEERFQPKTEQLQHAESVMDAGLPKEITANNHFEPVGSQTVNGVYTFNGDNGSRFYWKPQEEEGAGLKKTLEQNSLLRALNKNGSVRDTITENYGGREIANYELSKMLGVEGLIPPTKEFEHSVDGAESDTWHGPAQMDVHDLGRILGHRSVTSGPEMLNSESMQDIFSKSDNAQDMVAFDFITGNTDRHGANFFVGKKQEGGYHLIANDNGLSMPEHEGDIIHPDWENTFETQHNFYQSDAKSKPISENFLTGILSFDEAAFKKMAGEQGIAEKGQSGVVDRVKMVQDSIRNKYIAATEKYAGRDWNSIEERRDTLKKEVNFTGNDLEQIIRKNMMTTARANGEQKYTKKEMGSTWWSPKDWVNQIKYVFEGR